MNRSRIIHAPINSRGHAVTAPITQYDYGYRLLPEGVELPATYEIDFSNDEHKGTSLPVYGGAEGAEVPEELIRTGKDVYAFYYFVGDGFGKTEFTWKIPNNCRPSRDGQTPTPTQQSSIDQLIVRSNEAVESAEQSASDADQSARSASGDADRAERAKTGAETAQGKAEDAQGSAERAKDDAETSERNASESERQAKGYAETASAKADSIHSMTASAQTLPEGSSATASYDAETGVMSFGIPKGKDGTDGDDGYSPTANVSKSGKTATITITDKNGTTTAQVSDGKDGTDGIDGVSPAVSVTDITGGHRVVITDKDGAKSFDVEDGATGATPNLTIGTVETLEPTESATATITGTPENPVLNLGIPQGDAGEVTLEEFYKAFPTDTASGAIASFTDGADDLPLKSLVVNIDPAQDLHGQDSPYPAGGGKNKFQTTAMSNTVNGTTFTVNADGSIRISGTPTVNINGNYVFGEVTLQAGSYKLNGNAYQNDAVRLTCYNVTTSSYIASFYNNQDVSFTLTETSTLRLFPFVGTAYDGNAFTFYPMIRLASVTDATYAPYSNICPISGWTEVDVEQSGVNVWDEAWELGSFDSHGNPTTSSSYMRSKNYIPLIPNATYHFTRPSIIAWVYYYTDTDYIEYIQLGSGVKTFTPPSNATRAKFLVATSTYGTTYNNDISINYPSTDHSYHPYTGQSITISLGQTVYGAKLYPLEGKALITHKGVDMGLLSWSMQAGTGTQLARFLTSGIASDVSREQTQAGYAVMLDLKAPSLIPHENPVYSRNKDNTMCVACATGVFYAICTTYSSAADFETAVSGMMLVYRLANPIEIQLSANQINSLYGVNNIWADSGDTEAVYRADTKLFIERLTAPDSADMIADANITSGQYFMVGNSLYKATANIANGASIIVGTNAVRKSLSEALNEINA